MKRVRCSGVLGIFAHLDTTLGAVRQVEKMDFKEVRVISPVPRHEILEAVDPTPSPVRIYSLVGAVTGTLAGLALAILAGLWMEPMAFRVGGKPVVAWPAYFVIGFEVTVLLGAIATLLGFLIHAWLPRCTVRQSYDPRFTKDRFGVFVPCDASRWDEVKQALEQTGAEEVRFEPA